MSHTSHISLQDTYMTPGYKLYSYNNTQYKQYANFYPYLSMLVTQIDVNIYPVYGGTTWTRDDITIDTSANKVLVRVPIRDSTKNKVHNAISEMYYNRVKAYEKEELSFMADVFGDIGCHSFENMDAGKSKLLKSSITKSKQSWKVDDNIYIEGGNYIKAGNTLFIGEESKIAYDAMNSDSTINFQIYIKSKFGLSVVIIPQLLYHLDTFVLLLTPKIIVLPIIRTSCENEIWKSIVKSKTFSTCVSSIKKIFENSGFHVIHMDGFLIRENKLSANYFNCLSGINEKKESYVIVPCFDKEMDQTVETLFQEYVSHVYFVGTRIQNSLQISIEGGSLRCTTGS
jgi:N-dimethylarginine dimethylaminohydrolase